jgi:16S rRNA (cytosine967-C5)-methyltransferase
VTPGARAASAIAILERQLESKAPADLVAGSHFRSNRYIGSGDRQAIAAIVYGVLRKRAQLDWWITREGRLDPSTRLRVLTWLALAEGWTANQLGHAFDGDRFRPAPLDAAEARFAGRLETRTLDHPGQPPAVRLNLPEWIMPALEESLGASAAADLEALNQPAQLDLRVNALKTDRASALAALTASGIVAAPTPWSPWGMRVEGRPPLLRPSGLQGRPGRGPGRGLAARRPAGRRAARFSHLRLLRGRRREDSRPSRPLWLTRVMSMRATSRRGGSRAR